MICSLAEPFVIKFEKMTPPCDEDEVVDFLVILDFDGDELTTDDDPLCNIDEGL